MKVLETSGTNAIGNDEGFIADMYACDKEARKIYLEEAMNASTLCLMRCVMEQAVQQGVILIVRKNRK